MTQEEKQLLLQDLCARLPYGVKVHINSPIEEQNSMELFDVNFASGHIGVGNKKYIFRAIPIIDDEDETKVVKPYLRPMSNMTEVERKEYDSFLFDNLEREDVIGYEDKAFGIDVIMRYRSWDVVQWLLEHHLDFNGLIDIHGLALEAPEGMYNIK